MYQPESGAEPVKKGGVLLNVLHSPPPPRAQLCKRSCSNKHTHTNTHTPFSNWYKSREGGLEQGPFESPPLGGGLWARTCAVWCLLMHGSYRQGEGTNSGRLRVFSSAQAPWRVLLQALDPPSNSGKWNLGQYCTVSERGVLDKSKISRWGVLF